MNLSELINIYSPENPSENQGFLLISRGMKINSLQVIWRHRKFPLIRSGQFWWACIRGGVEGPYIQEEKHFNLQSAKRITFLSFFHYKARILAYFTLCKICSKLTKKTPEYIKLTIKLTIKKPLTLYWSPYCYIWTYFTSCYSVSIFDFDQLIAG